MDNVVDREFPFDMYQHEPHEPVTLADSLDRSLTDDVMIPLAFSDSDEQSRPSPDRAGSIPRRRGKNGMPIRSGSRSIGKDKDIVGSDADSERSMEGGSSSGSSSSRRHHHRENKHPDSSQTTSRPDIHSDNLRSPLSPLDPLYHSLRHKPSQTSTLTEPDTPLASLVPPANFAEQFKYIICSSGLLDPTTKLDQKRASLTARSRYASEVGVGGYGRPGSFVSTLGYGTDLDVHGQERDDSRSRTTTAQPIRSTYTRPSFSSNLSHSSLHEQQAITGRRPAPRSRASCSSTTYLTASSNSSRASTPTMTLNPLPIVDFDEPTFASPIASSSPVLLELPPGLRQRKRRRLASPNSSPSTPQPSPRRSDRSWSSLISALIKFTLRSTMTLTGYMWVWGWIQLNLVFGLGSWMIGFGWRIFFGWMNKRQVNASNDDNLAVSRDENVTRKTLPVPVQAGSPLASVETDIKAVNEDKENLIHTALPTPDIQVVLEAATVTPPSLQASALDMLSHLVTDNDAFEAAAMDAFERLSRANMDDGHDPLGELLRVRLHASMQGISTNLSSASSALVPLVSPQDLTGLQELYKINESSTAVVGQLTPDWEPRRFSSSSRDSTGIRLSVERSRTDLGSGEDATTPLDFDPLGFPQSTPLDEVGVTAGFPFTGRKSPASIRSAMPFEPANRPPSRPAFPTLRSSRSASSLNRLSAKPAGEDRFTPLPARSPRPSSVMGQSTWTGVRSKKRTQSLIGVVGSLGRSTSLASSKDYASRRTATATGDAFPAGHMWLRPGSTTDEGSMSDISRPQSTRPPSRMSDVDRRSPLMTAHAFNTMTHVSARSGDAKHSQLRPLMLPAQAQQRSDGSPRMIPADTPPLDTSLESNTSAMLDPRTHQRKRSSLQSIGFRRPSSVTQATGPYESPRPNRKQSPLMFTGSKPSMEDFIQGLPSDLVASLSRKSSRIGDNRQRSTQSYTVPAPRLDRAEDRPVDPLALSSLREQHRAMHNERRHTACCLLALRFQTAQVGVNQNGRQDPVVVARYWADVHAVLVDARTAIIKGTTDLQDVLVMYAARDPGSQPWHSQLGSQYAPRRSDASLLQDQLDDLARLLGTAQQRIAAVNQMISRPGGDHAVLQRTWDLLRADLGSTIGDWERGRVVVQRMTGATTDMLTARRTTSTSSRGGTYDYPLLDRETNTSTEMSLPSIPSMDELDHDQAPAGVTRDDATSYLLNSTSPAFLPPPGIESLFETHVARFAPPRPTALAPDGRKLTREERIEAMKRMREEIKSRQVGPTQGHGGGLDMTTSETRARTGEVVTELKDVIDRMKKHRPVVEMPPE